MIDPKALDNQRIVNIDGLAKYLQATKSNVRRLWKEYPHFFVGTGKDLKAARFDISDVLLYLKLHKGVGYERTAGSKNKKVGVQIRTPRTEHSPSLLSKDNPRMARLLQKPKDRNKDR